MTTPEPVDVHARAADDLHRMVLDMLPPDLFDLDDIDAARARLDGLLSAMPAPELPDGLSVDVETIAGLDDDPDLEVRVYRPAGVGQDAPALLWIHGGGLVLLDAASDEANCAQRAVNIGCVVVSVDYRLAPEAPFPAAVRDCYAALSWLADNTAELGVDPARIAIGGASAGGGLAAGLALMARDRGGPDICFQLLVFPMLDHRNVTHSSQVITDGRVWNRAANVAAWGYYLDGAVEVSPYASPAIATDVAGLPPAYIPVGDLDLFCDEDVAYAQALGRAGVPVELRVYPGAFHASSGLVAEAPLSVRWRADEDEALRRAFTAPGT
jgi:acetyl esterase/lipase